MKRLSISGACVAVFALLLGGCTDQTDIGDEPNAARDGGGGGADGEAGTNGCCLALATCLAPLAQVASCPAGGHCVISSVCCTQVTCWDPRVGADAAPDVRLDASPEAGADASPEAGLDASPEAGADASPEAGADADATTDAGPCTGTLQAVANAWGSTTACPSTYDAALAKAQLCAAQAWTSVGTCEGLAVIVHEWGTHSLACVYDGVGSAPLVGAAAVNDVQYFCGMTSWDIVAGQVPASCGIVTGRNSLQGSQYICPADAGARDGATDAGDARADAPAD
jgi:hypothetical protein